MHSEKIDRVIKKEVAFKNKNNPLIVSREHLAKIVEFRNKTDRLETDDVLTTDGVCLSVEHLGQKYIIEAPFEMRCNTQGRFEGPDKFIPSCQIAGEEYEEGFQKRYPRRLSLLASDYVEANPYEFDLKIKLPEQFVRIKDLSIELDGKTDNEMIMLRSEFEKKFGITN